MISPKSIVVSIKCSSYDQALVDAAIERGIEILGGAQAFAKPNENILLKPNVLNGLTAQNHVITPLPIFKATFRAFSQCGAKLLYGDSTGFFSSEFHMKASGYADAAAQLCVAQSDFDHGRSVSHPAPLICKSLPLTFGALNADGIISLSKLKTHGLVRFTGAIKNQFGCVLGAAKGRYHALYPNVYDFAKMLCDITSYLKPRLYIMDGIIAMEGAGPMGGEPLQLGIILMSTDPVALDAVACKIIGLDQYFVPTTEVAEAAGLGNANYENITILGDSIEDVITPDFKVERSRPPAFRLKKHRFQTLARLTIPKPQILEAKCTKCGRCVDACPVDPKAVNWGEDSGRNCAPKFNYSRCIRCFCCHEFCAFKAIEITKPIVGNILNRLLPIILFFRKRQQH